MKRHSFPDFFAGMATMLLIIALVGTAAATNGKVQKTLEYRNIGVSLDGQRLSLRDASGDVAEPFMFNGTNYVPARAIAEALGLSVSWDSRSNTVVLKSSSGFPSNPTQSETTIMNSNGIKVTYLGIEKNTGFLGGYNIKLKIQNSSSTNYTVQVRSLSVNGIMATHSVFSTDVTPGKTANTAILIYNLEKDGISGPINTAEFKLHVFNTNTYGDKLDSDIITINR